MSDESREVSIYTPVSPLQTADEARAAWDQFEALKSSLLKPNDYQKIGDKAFIKRSGFRKIALAFGISDVITEEERVDREDGSFYWRIKVVATAPNGRVNTGVGICDSAERKFSHVEHDVYATAHTRAKSRAISDMVAGGVVSAEEMEASASSSKRTASSPREPPKQVESTQYPSTTLSRYDPEAVAEALSRMGVAEDMIKVENENGYVVIHSVKNNYDVVDPIVRDWGFSWVAGGRKWKREI